MGNDYNVTLGSLAQALWESLIKIVPPTVELHLKVSGALVLILAVLWGAVLLSG